MKRIERILVKLVIIHAVLLILCQILLHHFSLFPVLNDLALYEGVTGQSFTNILEIFNPE